MSNDRFETIINVINNVCYETNTEESDVEYVVLQGLEKEDPYLLDPFILYKIAEFYNANWLGNADFMHIPNFLQVQYNCNNYPIIIAREKESKEIIGISTLKYDENKGETEDPYYPIPNEKYFSITGILTKMDNPYKGIGKKIYEIAIKGHYYFNKIYNDTSIMCVIDCRNKNSMNALHSAAKQLNEEVEETIIAKISGYYLLLDENKEMLEAPTMVLKVEESEKNQTKRNILEYEKTTTEKQFESLHSSIKDELSETLPPIIKEDAGVGLVYYYHVKNYNCLPKIISNGTEIGNNRIKENETNVTALCKVKTLRH